MNNDGTKYSDKHPNKKDANNFNEGITDLDIRDRRLMYQYNSLSPEVNPHGYKLSLACESGTDIIHSIGNVTAIGLQFIVDQFPTGTFATALPSTREAHRQLRHTPKEIRSQPYPLCIVQPRESMFAIDDRMAAGSFATSTYGSISSRFQNRSEMEKLFFDKRKGIEWRGKINRMVINLDFCLSFQSIAEQKNWASYLGNRIPVDGRFYFDIDTALELALPDGFLEETSQYAGIPVKDKNGDVSRFVDYLNMNSVFPVSYRFSSGKHRDGFYMHYMTAIMCRITDFNCQNVTKIGQVDSDCPITFTMRCEYNTIGLFDLSVPNPTQRVKLIQEKRSSVSIPIFSDCFNEKDFPLLYGWKILATPIVHMDWGENEVYIGGSFGTALNAIIDHHLEHNIPVDIVISIKLRENHDLINDGYYVDWKRRVLVFTNINYAHTYRLIMAINQLYINDLMLDMYGK
jgi:hypothetical protein